MVSSVAIRGSVTHRRAHVTKARFGRPAWREVQFGKTAPIVAEASSTLKEGADHRTSAPTISGYGIWTLDAWTAIRIVPEVTSTSEASKGGIATQNIKSVRFSTKTEGATCKLATNEGHNATIRILPGILPFPPCHTKATRGEWRVDRIPFSKCAIEGTPSVVLFDNRTTLAQIEYLAVECVGVGETQLTQRIHTSRTNSGIFRDEVGEEGAIPTELVEPINDGSSLHAPCGSALWLSQTLFNPCHELKGIGQTTIITMKGAPDRIGVDPVAWCRLSVRTDRRRAVGEVPHIDRIGATHEPTGGIPA